MHTQFAPCLAGISDQQWGQWLLRRGGSPQAPQGCRRVLQSRVPCISGSRAGHLTAPAGNQWGLGRVGTWPRKGRVLTKFSAIPIHLVLFQTLSLLTRFPKNSGEESLSHVDLDAVSQEGISTSTGLYMTSLCAELHQLKVLIRHSLLS